MNQVFVGIDASLSSTAVCIEVDGKEFYISYHKDKLSKWHKLIQDVVEYHQVQYTKNDDYSTSEIFKAVEYNKVAAQAIDRIKHHSQGLPVRAGMEGYSFGSDVGPLIDLVTIGSAIRYRLLTLTQDVTIYAPTSMKLECAKLVYEPEVKGKKVTYRNHQLIPGGSFKKHQMVLAMFEQERMHPLKQILLPYKDDILKMKAIPKPLDDIIDSYWAKEAKKYED